MKFTTRNAYYLRISAGAVLPLYLYLDEQHLEWMSERILQHVLADMRPLVLPKLIAEEDARLGPTGPANAKRGTVDVHRGDTYQFGYFLRTTEPHAVLIKTRRFTAAPKVVRPPQPAPAAEASTSTATAKGGRKRPRQTKGKAPAKKAPKRKGKAARVDHVTGSEDEAQFSDSVVDDEVAERPSVRRSTRKRKVAKGAYAEDEGDEENVYVPQDEVSEEAQDDVMEDEHMQDEDSAMVEDSEPPPPPLEDSLLVDEDEEEKPKPIMQLRYQGFSVHGRCLCVIVEPFPPVRKQRQMSLAPEGLRGPRAPSIAPPDFVPPGQTAQRAKTPLFLPDDDDDDFERRSVTPAPVPQRYRPPVPLFHETPEEQNEDDEDGGMMAFSQVLQTMGEYHTGAIDDDDEMDGMVLFGDADEAREL
ncbi:hypothetical protein BDW22DRAFT_1387298 [Trametopsis cervina]|nr:hypothetical protein BDW22DRAFT_1387298 [Trametopsis cervina]